MQTSAIEARVNMAVGRELRSQRKRLGLSQTNVGQGISVTYQQIQKYEYGKNRMALDTLVSLEESTGISAMAIVRAAQEAVHAS